MLNNDYMAGLERHAREKYSNKDGKPMPPPLSQTSDKRAERKEAQRKMEEYSRSLRDSDNQGNRTNISRPGTSGPGSSSGSQSTLKFKSYIPTDKRAAQSGKWGFYNGGGGGGGGGRPDNGGGGGGFAAPHLQNNTSSSNKSRSSSHCDSGYSSSSSGGLGRRNSSFNMGSPHSQQDSGNRSSYSSGSFGGLDSYAAGGERNRHPASSGSNSNRQFGRSMSESSASSMGSSGGFGGLNLAAIYEKEFGKNNKKK